ncbi:LCP family protein [Candidatus Dojkabacteria bacterium]|nr:LCP family protein [Candidatus Dojkabacteria bacterium]
MSPVQIEINNKTKGKKLFGKLVNLGKNGKKTTDKKITKDKPAKPQNKVFKYIKTAILLILFAAIGYGGYFAITTFASLKKAGIKLDVNDAIQATLTQQEPELLKDENNRTSVLIVGIDTRDTDAGLQNTDTIIIATIDHKTKQVTMISIPRDFWAENPRYPGYFSKINAVYNSCEIEESGTGPYCLRDTAQAITGIEIQYFIMVDMSGAQKMIDTLGGIDVDVDNSFTDYMYPTPEGYYETISFEAGTQHMDGETALKFARSRHAQSSEGSDFARARRQQKVIIATKEKALSTDGLFNPVKITELLSDFGNSVKMINLTTGEGITVSDIIAAKNIAGKVDKDKMYTMVLDPMAGNWSLIAAGPGSAFSSILGEGNYSDIQIFVSEFTNNPAIYSENAFVYVYNGGLGYNETYAKYQELVAQYPYMNVTFGGNVYNQNLTGVTVVSYSENPEYATLNAIDEMYSCEWTNTPPENVSKIYGEDIAIIFGVQ